MAFAPSKMTFREQPQSLPQEWNRLTERIIGAAMEVHTHLGPGLREKFYEHALLHELTLRGIKWDQQVPFRVLYKDKDLGIQLIDTVAEGLVILELKAATVTDVDKSQLVGYLRFTGLPLGLLINFHVARLREGIIRKINWPPKHEPGAVRIISPPSSESSVLSSAPSVFTP
jgi:GxxExxY protein